ncbi:MAG: GTPase Era [Rickettsiales bacterium]|jgi:GTP-binding protein Era|nr:GTPase Era [Rickettsiales bacterium]
MKKRFGYCALLGATNAGKSTLLNTIASEKIAIVSRKVQTTRENIRGVRNLEEVQMAFVDTPGVFDAKSKFDRAMVSAAWSAMDGADAVVYIIDAAKGLTRTSEKIIGKLGSVGSPKCAAINKIDAVKKPELLELAQAAYSTGLFEEVFMISAKKNDGVDDLIKWVASKMPEGEWRFDRPTDASAEFRMAEITREKIYEYLHNELPYMIAVRTDEIARANVRQTIITSEKTHKAIIIGSRGEKLKTIGIKARAEMEKLVGHKINLELEVEVDKDWKNNPEFYSRRRDSCCNAARIDI